MSFLGRKLEVHYTNIARLLIASGAKQEASQIYKQLLDQNNDCKFYFTQLESLQSESLEAFYAELKESYPKSNIIQLALLKNATRDNFLGRLEKYCIPALIKGVPSLFVALKDLYNSEWKIPIIESLFTRFYSSLFETKSLNETPAPPTTAVWILYYQSQHFDLLGNHTLALDFINNAIQHTPTLPDLYMFKARIYKHIGSPALASETMDFARSLDLQDRFVNSKSCKYMLRNENETLALETIKLFTKVDTDVISDLNEMQCIWVSIEIAESCFRNAKYGKALKKYQIIDRYFNDHYDDQFDFHSYCLRKVFLFNLDYFT